MKYQCLRKKSATQVLLRMLAHSSLAFCDYEIQTFPQQNLSWLKFSFGKAFYYGNEIICLPAEGLTPAWAQVLTLPQSNTLYIKSVRLDAQYATTGRFLTQHIAQLYQVNFNSNWCRQMKILQMVFQWICPYLYASSTVWMWGKHATPQPSCMYYAVKIDLW